MTPSGAVRQVIERMFAFAKCRHSWSPCGVYYHELSLHRKEPPLVHIDPFTLCAETH